MSRRPQRPYYGEGSYLVRSIEVNNVLVVSGYCAAPASYSGLVGQSSEFESLFRSGGAHSIISARCGQEIYGFEVD